MAEFEQPEMTVSVDETPATEKLLQLINRNVNRHGTAQEKKLDGLYDEQEEIKEVLESMSANIETLASDLSERIVDQLDTESDDEDADVVKQDKPREGFFKLVSKSLKDIYYGLQGTTQEEARKRKAELDAERERRRESSRIYQMLYSVRDTIASYGDKMKDWLTDKTDKLGNYGLVGKMFQGIIRGVGLLATKVIWPILQFGLSVLKFGGVFLAKAALVVGLITTVFTFAKAIGAFFADVKNFGFTVAIEKLKEFFDGLSNWNPAKWLAKGAIAIGEFLGGVIADVILGLTKVPSMLLDGIKSIGSSIANFFADTVDNIRSKLPEFMGGISKEEAEANKAARRGDPNLKKTPKGMMTFDQANKARAAIGNQPLTVEDYNKLVDQHNAMVNPKAANAPTTTIKSADVKQIDSPKAGTVTSSSPTDVKQPDVPQQTADPGKQVVKETVIIKEVQSGVDVADYIGTASTVATNMTRK